MSAIDWLLDSDPAIRWQALRDLTDAPADQVAAERARVATDGWGARLLAPRRDMGLDTAFTLFSFPTGWHYDALRGLDYLREAGVAPDARVAEAIHLVRSKPDPDGRWPLENLHESELVNARTRDLDLDMDEHAGRPSRWNTLRALRVLEWYERGA